MPIFPFHCPSCEHEVEHFLSLEERDAIRYCERCQHVLERLLAPSSIAKVTKGGNWYGFESNRPPKGNRKVITIETYLGDKGPR